MSIGKIGSLVQHLSTTIQNPDISINTNTSDLEVCSDKCVSYNIFRFGALLGRYIPEYIHYKIELNKNFLYTNFREQNYQIEKVHHINDRNQLNIHLSIDNIFWSKLEAEIQKPLKLLILIITSSILSLYGLYKIFIKSLNKAYMLDYQANYKEELEHLKSEHQQELKNCKTSLMNKIWNLGFNKQKDLEINCLLAQEANKIALVDANLNEQGDIIKDSRLQNFSDQIPCSIILYKNNQLEEIKVEELINLFTDRFDQENENITIKIVRQNKIGIFFF